MVILEIRKFPDPILRRKARHVPAVDDAIRHLARDMVETLHHAQGVGLAGNQVGELKRLVVLRMPEEEEARILVNPAIVRREGERRVDEGCLSVPGYMGLITRSIRVRARALDEWGGKLRLSAEEILAQAIEHEIDHLNGVLFFDHLESHEDLREISQDNGAHQHDVEYAVEVQGDGGEPVEQLRADAALSVLGPGAAVSDFAFDLTDGVGRPAAKPEGDPLRGGVLLEPGKAAEGRPVSDP